MTEKVMRIFLAHLKTKHDLILYDYQKQIAERVFAALIQNMRLTLGATEADIKKLKRIEIAIEISRQAGKTTAITAIIEVVMIYFTQMFNKELDTGIFAPQREQSKTDFDRLKTMLMRDSDFTVIDHDKEAKARDESNAKTLVLPNGSSSYVFPITATSKPESKSLHLIVVEEAQDADDRILKEQIWPMGAATNAPIIYIGTAGTRICHFYRLGQGSNALKLYYPDVIKDRREVYKSTGDVQHLIYEQNVKELIELYGIESDEIQRPYFGKWLIGTGQFVTQEALEALEDDRLPTFHDKHSECFAGIDTAKHPDSTVVTILRFNKKRQLKEVINWLELRGENYQDQFEIIHEFLGNYNVQAVAIDSTGQGDFMPDMFENNTEWASEHSGLYRVKFSAVSKDIIYKNLKVSIEELLTRLPKLDTKKTEKFRQELLDLQQEYKGQLLSVHHPDATNAHDDFPDSWALAEYAYACYNRDNNADVHFINTKEEPNNVAVLTKKSKRKTETIDYWSDDWSD